MGQSLVVDQGREHVHTRFNSLPSFKIGVTFESFSEIGRPIVKVFVAWGTYCGEFHREMVGNVETAGS